jgi:membrane-associated phospholipid phosphatase
VSEWRGDGVKERRRDALTPADKVVTAYLALIALLTVTFRVEGWERYCALHLILIIAVHLLASWERSSRSRPLAASSHLPIARFIHGWYPVPLIPTTFKELGPLIPEIHPRDFDSALAAIDYRVFGMHPTVWMERFTWPPLTELLQICYPTYYVLPIILGAVIWRSDNAEGFRFWVFVVVLGFYLSYLGYMVVPAIGPRFLPEILEAQNKPLTGVFFYQTVRDTLDRAEGLTRDCFPSGHTAMTLLVLYYARQFHRKTFRVLLPLGIAIIVSTVYLRYHYVVDLAAGALLAGVVILAAQRAFAALGGKTQGHASAATRV